MSQKRRIDGGQKGLSLVELMFVMAMTGVVLVAITTYTFRSRLGLAKLEVGGELQSEVARISSNLRASLNGSVILLANYGGSPDFTAYQGWVPTTLYANSKLPWPAGFSQHPTVSNASLVSQVPADSWGDELLFLSAMTPVTFTVNYGACTTCTAAVISVDRLQFVYIYLTLKKTKGTALSTVPRLVEWRSQPYISYASIKDFSNSASAPRLSSTCQTLVNMGYTWAIDTNAIADPVHAFYAIRQPPTSPLLYLDPAGPPAPPMSSWAYMDEYDYMANFNPQPGKNLGQVSRRHAAMTSAPGTFGLAFNTYNPTANSQYKVNGLYGIGKNLTVPASATPDLNGNPGFPAGFEVSIAGKPSVREVNIRFVVMGLAGTNPRARAKTYAADEGVLTMAVKNDY